MTLVPLVIATLLLVIYFLQRVLGRTKDSDSFKAKLASYEVPADLESATDKAEIDILRRVFAHYDADGSGTIDEVELSAVLKEFREGKDDASIAAKSAEMIKSVSTNGENSINFGELLRSLTQAHEEGSSSTFAALTAKVEADEIRSKGQTVFYAFLFLTFLVMSSTSATLFQCVVVHS